MNKKTFVLCVLMKWLELAYNIACFVCMIITIIPLKDYYPGFVVMLGSVAIIFAYFNIGYSNVLFNCRYALKRPGSDCHELCFKYPNNLCLCYCFLKKVCKEQLFEKNATGEKKLSFLCLAKWSLQYLFFGAVIAIMFHLKSNDEMYDELHDQKGIFLFENFLIMYILQHWIFAIIRPFLFTIWTMVTCCCDCG